MCQQGVYKILKKNLDKWLTSRDIIEKLGSYCVRTNLTKMYKAGEVFRKEIKLNGHNCYVYKLK